VPPSILRAGRIGLLALLCIVPASCSWTSGDQYFIHWGTGRNDVVIRERTTWDLTLAHDLFLNDNDIFASQMGGFRCHAGGSPSRARKCVMRLLNERTEIPSLAKGVWNRATDPLTPGRVDDFSGAFGRILPSARDDLKVADCLTLSVYPHTVNWTERDRSHDHCLLGKHVWE
jgi:hypothetical protein